MCSLLAGFEGNCVSGDRIACSGSELTHIEPAYVPRGPGGDWPKPACVELLVLIGNDGKPNNISIEKSSRNRALDLAILNAVGSYRFKAQDKNAGMLERNIFVWYKGTGSEVNLVNIC